MTVMTSSSVNRAPRPSSLVDVLDLVLDKGIVIDAYVRVALVGIELLTIDARIVIASVDTYLRFAEAVNRLDLQPEQQAKGLPGLMEDLQRGGAREKTRGALAGAADAAREAAGRAVQAVTGRGGEAEGRREREPVPVRREAPPERSAPRERSSPRRTER
jgi:hypothetical protein